MNLHLRLDTESLSMTSVETNKVPETENPKLQDQTGLNNPKTVRILQIAVVAMGIILVIGLITVLGRIFYLYFGMNKTPSSISQHMSSGTTSSLTLPHGAQITSMSLYQNRLAIHFKAPSGNGIRVLNTQTGIVENTINISPAIPEN